MHAFRGCRDSPRSTVRWVDSSKDRPTHRKSLVEGLADAVAPKRSGQEQLRRRDDRNRVLGARCRRDCPRPIRVELDRGDGDGVPSDPDADRPVLLFRRERQSDQRHQSLESVERRMVAKRRYRLLRAGPSPTCITYAASAVQRIGDGFSSSRISSAVVPLNGPSYSFFALYAATARRTTGCSCRVKFMTLM